MKKLALNIDDLKVESFDTSAGHAPRGTVVGNDVSETTCNQVICDCYSNGAECETNYNCPVETDTCPVETDNSCRLSCDHSCFGTGCRPTCGYSCGGTCFHTDVCWCA